MSQDTADNTMATDERFAINLDAMAKWAPKLHARLSRLETTHSQLVTRPEGGLDMSMQRQYFYGRDAAAYAREQVEGYRRAPVRRFFSEPRAEILAPTAGDYLLKVMGRAADEGVEVNYARVESSSYYTIVFGIGLGLHLEALLELSVCRALILVEPNIENIYHSLSVIDWTRIFESTDGTPRHVRFVLGNDPASLSLNVTQVVRGLSPALLDGVYIFTHYYSSVLENAKERFQRDFRLCLTGLGYFEDELIMTANAAGNLARCPLALLEGLHPERDEPVLIVGSGPSIDGDMGFLVENAERAVIISIGTGLAGLLAAGIRPDFHVELENTLINERMVRLTDEEFGLHGVTLLGSMTVLPELAARFGDTIMFFRELLTSTMLFGENCGTVSPSGPTVANAALVSAIMMGFRSIYLFGVDMGTRSRSSYHSEGSLYGRGRVADCALDEQMHVAPANFGGEAYAEQVLVWSRSVLEVTLRSHPTVRCYNCSDGVRIAYAIPKVTRVVDLPPQPIDRRAVVDAIRGNLVVYSDERRRRVWDHGERRAEAEAFFAHLCTIIDRAALQPDPGRGWIHELCEAIEHDGPAPVPLWSFLHGSISLMLGTTWWYERRLTSPEAQRRFRRMAMSELRIAIEAMASRLAQLYDDVDEFFAGNLDRVPVTYVD